MKKESLLIRTVKTLLAVIIFTGVGTIIIGGAWLIGKQYKTNDKIVKSVNQETEAVSKKDISECEKISVKFRKEECYAEIAKQDSNILVCDEIELDEIKNKCINEVMKTNPDKEKCLKLKDQKDIELCISIVAGYNNNPSLCNNLEMKDFCYVIVAVGNGNELLCEKVEKATGSRDLCFSGVAQEKKDHKICEKISNEMFKDSCYRSVAEEKGDIEICNKMQNSEERVRCYLHIASKLKDSSYCEFDESWIPENVSGLSKDSCYERIARENLRESDCWKISKEHIKSRCFYDVAVGLKDLAVCTYIKDSDKKEKCHFEIAKESDNIENIKYYCEKIKGSYVNILTDVFGNEDFLTWCVECRKKGMPQKKGFYDAFCNLKTKDADEVCKDSNECEGMCIVERLYDIEGKCSKYINFEENKCEDVIRSGKVVRECNER